MSRGPGKIERAVTELLLANPSGTFMLEDLAARAYPGVNQLEKKHRVSLLRAVRNAKFPDACWWYWKVANDVKGCPYVLFNRLNLRSIGVCEERSRPNNYSDKLAISDADAEARCFEAKAKVRPYILTDGAYPVLIEYYRAALAKDTGRAEALWEDYKSLVNRAVYGKYADGELHPDFLRDCLPQNLQQPA